MSSIAAGGTSNSYISEIEPRPLEIARGNFFQSINDNEIWNLATAFLQRCVRSFNTLQLLVVRSNFDEKKDSVVRFLGVQIVGS